MCIKYKKNVLLLFRLHNSDVFFLFVDRVVQSDRSTSPPPLEKYGPKFSRNDGLENLAECRILLDIVQTLLPPGSYVRCRGDEPAQITHRRLDWEIKGFEKQCSQDIPSSDATQQCDCTRSPQ